MVSKMLNHQLDRVPARTDRYDYQDHTVFAIDLGPTTSPTVDIVDHTAIIVTNDDQHELDLPDGEVEAINKNGIITIKVEE